MSKDFIEVSIGEKTFKVEFRMGAIRALEKEIGHGVIMKGGFGPEIGFQLFRAGIKKHHPKFSLADTNELFEDMDRHDAAKFMKDYIRIQELYVDFMSGTEDEPSFLDSTKKDTASSESK